MKTTIIITKRGDGYIGTVGARNSIVLQGVRCGLTPHDAATWAATMMLRYASPDSNVEGGELMAPTEVFDLVPDHLRKIG